MLGSAAAAAASPLRTCPVADIDECRRASVCPENLECVNVPGSFTCSGLFTSFHLTSGFIQRSLLLLRRVLSWAEAEPSPLAAASVVGAVMVVLGGAASLLLLLFCYRRYDRPLTTRLQRETQVTKGSLCRYLLHREELGSGCCPDKG